MHKCVECIHTKDDETMQLFFLRDANVQQSSCGTGGNFTRSQNWLHIGSGIRIRLDVVMGELPFSWLQWHISFHINDLRSA